MFRAVLYVQNLVILLWVVFDDYLRAIEAKRFTLKRGGRGEGAAAPAVVGVHVLMLL